MCLLRRVVSEGISFVESEDDERPSWTSVRFQNTMFIYEATEHFARFLQAFAFPNVLAMARFLIVVNLLAAFHKLEKTVILIKTGKVRNFTCLVVLVTSV